MQFNKIKLALGLAGALTLSTGVYAAADQEKAISDPNNWAHPRGNHTNNGHSALSQINKDNVKDLKAAWTFATGVNRGHEGAPLVIGSTMYVHTAFPNNVYALDLNNDQKIVWSYFPKQDPSVQAVLCCDNVNRGLGFGDGKIFLQQNHPGLIEISQRTPLIDYSQCLSKALNHSKNIPNIGVLNNATMAIFYWCPSKQPDAIE